MSTTTSSSKIAGAFAGLGFRVVMDQTEIIELRSWKNLRFEISEHSLLRPQLPHRDDILKAWLDGKLAKADPLHPFLCGMIACHNYDQLLDMQDTAELYRLQLVDPRSALYRYERGVEDPRLKLAPTGHKIQDLPLAAAVGLAGAPVVNILGPAGAREYVIPELTVPQLVFPGLVPQFTVGQMLERNVPGKLPLRLGMLDAHHPVVQGYNGVRSYARLLSEIRKIKQRLLVKDPYSGRRALIPENPSAKLEDEVRLHFRIP